MDPAGIIGMVVAFGAIFGAMMLEGADPMSVMLPAPLLLVWVGTLGVGLAGHTLRDANKLGQPCAHQSRSMMVTLACPPPSHIVCSP